jgi:hypothetical protein
MAKRAITITFSNVDFARKGVCARVTNAILLLEHNDEVTKQTDKQLRDDLSDKRAIVGTTVVPLDGMAAY